MSICRLALNPKKVYVAICMSILGVVGHLMSPHTIPDLDKSKFIIIFGCQNFSGGL